MTEIHKSWSFETVDFSKVQKPYHNTPQVGMVIGTFASIPYIHLQLESRKRYFPDTPVLVHDDCSPFGKEMAKLCREYGCDFSYNSERLSATIGDVSSFVSGFAWAKEKDIDVLLKVSRRWIWTTNWTQSLRTLAKDSQYATFCNSSISFNYGFRTECVGMSVKYWGEGMVNLNIINKCIENKEIFVEGYMHEWARKLEIDNCYEANIWKNKYPRNNDKNGYAVWDLMGDDRCKKTPERIWHDSDGPESYAILAKSWDLPYTLNDFKDPNMGCKDRP